MSNEDQGTKSPAGESDFSDVFAEVNAISTPVDKAYELLRILNSQKKQNGLTLVAAHVQGDRGQMEKFFNEHPELPQLKENDLDVLAQRYKKDLIKSIYFNFINITKGEDVDLEKMQELMSDEKELLSNFQKLSKVKLKENVFTILREYLKAKREAENKDDPQIMQMFLFFDVGNEALERLIMELEKLSEKINKDIISDLLQRREIEIGLDKIVAKGEDVFTAGQVYSQVNDQIQNILDKNKYEEVKKSMGLMSEEGDSKILNLTTKELDDFIKKEQADLEDKKKKLQGLSGRAKRDAEAEIAEKDSRLKEPANLRDLALNLLQVIPLELKFLEKNSDRYEDMEDAQKTMIKNQLEKFKKIVAERPVNSLDLQTLSFLGELVEKRVKHNQDVIDIYNDLSGRYQEEYL